LYKTKRELRKEILQMPKDEMQRIIQTLEEEMRSAAEELEFERAAQLRDEIVELRKELSAEHR
jgi:excinuclease ABC subunit B